MMTRALLLALACLNAAPLAAQEEPPSSLMEKGAQMFLEGLLNEMEPALKGMQEFADQMGPALRDILREVEDWSVYEPPEVLPNGDIIIRRKPRTEPGPQPEPESAPPPVDL